MRYGKVRESILLVRIIYSFQVRSLQWHGLDLEYATALVDLLNVTLYQVGDLIDLDCTSFHYFLDVFDSWYCAGPTIGVIFTSLETLLSEH